VPEDEQFHVAPQSRAVPLVIITPHSHTFWRLRLC
jgi:hypothetical protein